MKLKLADIFGERMVLQRREAIPVWGRSVGEDRITVALGEDTAEAVAENGEWKVELPAREAATGLTLTVSSALTGEKLVISEVAVGEVWLAGGQSNMEFLLKYDEKAEEMYDTPSDPDLRFFRYPCVNFTGLLELDPFPNDGFWRTWTDKENRKMFSAACAFMGRLLREDLKVPVAFIGANWGGTPAAAWTDIDSIKENPAMKPILQAYEDGLKELNLLKYYTLSDQPPVPEDPKERARRDAFMTGQGGAGMEAMLAEMQRRRKEAEERGETWPPKSDYTAYMMGPRGAIRPAGLYDDMITKIAPYKIAGAVWYQGEDDDFRNWQDFYDESMITLIKSWRKLWNKPLLPFLQVELAPFRGRGFNGAKRYPFMRTQQRKAQDTLPAVHDVCIMDSGDAMNIHVRKKKPVGIRLALLAEKYVYGLDVKADSPRALCGNISGDRAEISFSYTEGGLKAEGEWNELIAVTVNGEPAEFKAVIEGEKMVVISDAFKGAERVRIEFAEQNFCEDTVWNQAGLPVFPFTMKYARNGQEEKVWME